MIEGERGGGGGLGMGEEGGGHQKIRLVVGLQGREGDGIELVLVVKELAIPEGVLVHSLATKIFHAVTHEARLLIRLHAGLAQDLQHYLGAYI